MPPNSASAPSLSNATAAPLLSSPTAAPSPRNPAAALPLHEWLRVLAPPYRGILALLLGLNALSAIAVFVELQVLRSLTVVLSRGATPADGLCSFAGWAGAGFPIEPQPCGASLPVFLLATYAVTVAAQSAVDFAGLAANNRLVQRARRDVERELLRNLLRQDDAFYLRRAPSEIISRLGGDLARVGGRRQIMVQAVSTALSVVAVTWVLVAQSWLAAAVGVAISLLGLAAAAPILRRQRDLDSRMVQGDEAVKAGFEDTLQGVAEIQVSGLLRGVLNRFGRLQAVRDRVALENADVNSAMSVGQKLTFAFGFIAALSLVVFTDLFRGADGPDGGSATAGLIVVLISTLPQLYYKFGDLTQLFGQFQVADVSADRLRQYEAPPDAPAAARSGDAVVLDGVRYRFAGSHAVQGGPAGLNLVVPPCGLLGVVGPAGAGKSTLVRIMLGRQRPLEGTVTHPATHPASPGPDATFVYLPQRPIMFDAPLRDNLFGAGTPPDPAALAAVGERLGGLGLLDLVRQKGLDAAPDPVAASGLDLRAVRAGFRGATEAALGTRLHTLAPGHGTPRQMLIEGQLGCAADGEAVARRLTSAHSREAVRALAATPFGREMAALAAALVRQTAPLLAEAGSPDDYNRIAAAKIEQGTWQLRMAALDALSSPAPPPSDAVAPLLVAVALSARIGELEGAALPVPGADAQGPLGAVVAGISHPFEADRLNPLLTWRENLLFAVPDPSNVRRLEQVDRLVLEHLRGSPVDAAVLEAGLDYPVGRGGGRLSGGQQQLVALGRALLSPAPFLVLDEPSSAFHPRLRAELVRVLQAEARTRSVVVVTHDMDLARGCGRLVFVRDGAIAADASWADLAHNPEFEEWLQHGTAA